MSRQVDPPYRRQRDDGTHETVTPAVGCEDCGTRIVHPHRVYSVAEPRREVCANCWSAPRVAPSVLQPNEYRLEINITLQKSDYSSGRLEIRESLELTAFNFFEMAAILGRFHELAETLKARNDHPEPQP